MVKVLVDYGAFSAQKFGGISRYFVELARNLDKFEDVSVKVVAPVHVNAYLPEISSKNRFGILVPEIRYTGVVRGVVNRAVTTLYDQWYRSDVVHETFYRVPWRRSGRSRTCVTVYDMIHEQFSEMIPVAERALFDRNLAVKKQVIDRADMIICISERTRDDLIRIYNIPRQKTRVIYLSGGLTPTAPATGSRPFLLFVGSRGWYKNFETVLRAFGTSEVLKSEFDLVCFGGGDFTGPERMLMAHLGVEGKVRNVSGDDTHLSSVYRAARAFVFPSRYEGFGIPLLESMWANCPVIASRASCFPEIAGNAAEYFETMSVDDCKRALELVCLDDDHRHALIEAGEVRRSLFSWQKTAAETRQVYLEIGR